MPKKTMIGSFACRAGQGDAMAAVLLKMVEAARHEPGCEVYSYHRGPDDTFWFFALMTDEAAMAAHGQSEAMQAAMAEFGPLVAGPPSMTPCSPVGAIGLELDPP